MKLWVNFRTKLNFSKKRFKNKLLPHKSYSQSGEDLIVRFIFSVLGISKPSYLDIGAHHPFWLNNTMLFYEEGSNGINIEPDTNMYKSLCKYRPKDLNLNIGISDKKETLNFYIFSSPTLNTFSKEEAFKIAKESQHKIIETKLIHTDTISNLINKYYSNHSPDFLSIDIEGLEMDILSDINFYAFTPTVICVETISFSEERKGVKNHQLINLLTSNGYFVYADTYINTIFVRKSKWD